MVVAKVYWFRVPVIGIGISLAFYAASLVAALTWHFIQSRSLSRPRLEALVHESS